MTTIYDIARAVGVTQTTVANALAGRGNVSEATRQRVLQCAQELNYRPNTIARSLVQRKTYTLALLLPTIANPYYPEIAEAVEGIANQHEYQLLLCNTHYDFALGRQHLDRLASRWIDGIIALGWSMALADIVAHFQRGIPTVLCDWSDPQVPPELPQVKVDFYHAGVLAAEHLLALGHRQVAVIVDEPGQTIRLDGFRSTFQAAGITIAPHMIQQGHSTLESGYHAAQRLLTQAQPPTALFTTNDWMAIGALEAVQDAGLSVPRDVSVVGLDDIMLAAHVRPRLTTVAIPKQEFAQAATELLLQQINGTLQGSQVTRITPYLVPRQSTAAPSTTMLQS